MIYGFGDRLKYFRQQHNLTQERLANQLGVDYSTVGRYERNLTTPSIEVFYDICLTLDINADYLLGLDRKVKLVADGLKPEQQGVINDYVKALKNSQNNI